MDTNKRETKFRPRRSSSWRHVEMAQLLCWFFVANLEGEREKVADSNRWVASLWFHLKSEPT